MIENEIYCPVCNHSRPISCNYMSLRDMILEHSKEEITNALIEYAEGRRIID